MGNTKYKILVTCPPMIGMIDSFQSEFESHNAEYDAPDVIQTLSEQELIDLLPDYDGWIIGDDPVTHKVLQSCQGGKLKAAIKWGIGIDNIDFKAAEMIGLPITNTPGMFGDEVADIALAYIIGLARNTYRIDREIRNNKWPKYCGISLNGKKAGIVGFGDIGQQLARRLLALKMGLLVYDPAYSTLPGWMAGKISTWPDGIEDCDFIVFTCSLNKSNYQMLNKQVFDRCKKGVRIVNVSRGGLVNESDLVNALETGQVHSVALDVMKTEPLPTDSALRKYDNCIFGSHNASNTSEAVRKTSLVAINKLFELLEK